MLVRYPCTWIKYLKSATVDNSVQNFIFYQAGMSCYGYIGDNKTHKLFFDSLTAKNKRRSIEEGDNFTSTTGDFID